MMSRKNTGFSAQLAAVLVMPLLFTLGFAMLPVMLIVYALVINLLRLTNWLVDAVLGIGE